MSAPPTPVSQITDRLRKLRLGASLVWLVSVVICSWLLRSLSGLGAHGTSAALVLAGVVIGRAWMLRGKGENAVPRFFFWGAVVLWSAGGNLVAGIALVTYVVLRELERREAPRPRAIAGSDNARGSRPNLSGAATAMSSRSIPQLPGLRPPSFRFPRLSRRVAIAAGVVLFALAGVGFFIYQARVARADLAEAKTAVVEAIPAAEAFGNHCDGWNSESAVPCTSGGRRVFSVAALQSNDHAVSLSHVVGTATDYCIDDSVGGQTAAYIRPGSRFVTGKSCSQLISEEYAANRASIVHALSNGGPGEAAKVELRLAEKHVLTYAAKHQTVTRWLDQPPVVHHHGFKGMTLQSLDAHATGLTELNPLRPYYETLKTYCISATFRGQSSSLHGSYTFNGVKRVWQVQPGTISHGFCWQLVAATAGLSTAEQSVRDAIPAIEAFGSLCHGYDSSSPVSCSDGVKRVFSVTALKKLDPSIKLSDASGLDQSYCVDSTVNGQSVADVYPGQGIVSGKTCAQLAAKK